MWIQREISSYLDANNAQFIQILLGPRQCGKSSLFYFLGQNIFHEIVFDDFQMRNLAGQDPALFLSQNPPPLILDEIQYVPALFPELKKIIDQFKKKNLFSNRPTSVKTLYRLTGSNLILLSEEVRESLVGRAGYFYLNTLSVSEILRSFPELTIGEILFKGGWPELYTNPALKIVQYLNDYISNYLEKDIARSAGIQKMREFDLVIGLLAARVGQLLNYADVAKDSGVKGVTIKEWIGLLEKSFLIYTLHPYESNLNKRLIKTPKIYFWDSGLAVRLQGWSEQGPMIKSPQIGFLFENLVLSEILKYRQNHMKNWKISFWRNKDGEEVDFLIQLDKDVHLALDAKWGMNLSPQNLPRDLKKEFPKLKELILISPAGPAEGRRLSPECFQIPLTHLGHFLTKFSAK